MRMFGAGYPRGPEEKKNTATHTLNTEILNRLFSTDW